MQAKKQQAKRKENKRPLTKNDFELVLKAVTQPLKKKKQVSKESGKT